MGQICGRESDANKQPILLPTHKQGVTQLKQNYSIDHKTKILGQGAFGKVYQTYNREFPDFRVAVKIMNKEDLQDSLDAIQEEVAILTQLDHPNIVKYYETYNDEKFIYLVMEYIDGGELFEKLTHSDNQTFSESQAKVYMEKLLGACNHMHA